FAVAESPEPTVAAGQGVVPST
ncbi:hypothetical protein A2U01_0104781, partial [Trifolium medium]|nr:hypothetical protein [Trifolium medium]